MAADGTALLGPNSFAFALDFTTLEDDAAVEEELARRRDRDASEKKTDGDAPAKKRGRDGGLDRGEESRGWSSALEERGFALRRRGGSASCRRRRCGLIVGEEARCREEAAASGAAPGLGAEAADVATELPVVDPTSLELFYLAVL